MGKRLAKKVLVIGWDAADWEIINPLMEKGLMPTLEKFINQGVMGKISTLDPPLSPMLWTSIGTGKTAEKHGILGFSEPNATTQTIRPVSVTSRKVKAIWNILTHENYKTHLVGWWPSHPAEPMVSRRGGDQSRRWHAPAPGPQFERHAGQHDLGRRARDRRGFRHHPAGDRSHAGEQGGFHSLQRRAG